MKERHLGTDLLFDEDGDLTVNRTGDLALAVGRKCLLQDIRDRLQTLPGDLFAHPDWGCGVGKLLGALDTPLSRVLAIRYIRYALESDPRVEDNTIAILDFFNDLAKGCHVIAITLHWNDVHGWEKWSKKRPLHESFSGEVINPAAAANPGERWVEEARVVDCDDEWSRLGHAFGMNDAQSKKHPGEEL